MSAFFDEFLAACGGQWCCVTFAFVQVYEVSSMLPSASHVEPVLASAHYYPRGGVPPSRAISAGERESAIVILA